MKKNFLMMAVAVMAALALTSCEETNSTPWLKPVVTSDGVFVINNGNEWVGTNGSLTYYDYDTKTATQDVYLAKNGVSLGSTPNHAIVYGSKIYIVGSGEKTVFVADKNTMRKVKNIKMEVKGEPVTPRQAVAGYGYVFVSTFSNTVIAIDTITNTIATTYRSGDYSEGMAINGAYLYVANSNYGRGKEENARPSISAININKDDTVMFVSDKLHNPIDVKVVNGRIFVLDSGTYDEDGTQKDAGLYEIENNRLVFRAAATEMAVGGTKIFLINAPFIGSELAVPTYTVYETTNNRSTTLCEGTEIGYPSKISVDAVEGYVYITAYHIGSNGFPDYNTPGYCVIYDAKGNKQGSFYCGIGPGYVVPNLSVDYVQM